ncbi:MAG TPA: N-acetylmuramoyl-L-alanine amidase-like domain-containing protein [Fibrobacteria bacterium]|nr:N-acetylmuramoyl-L-alanine amidase-like domain-containing protein [Fibrobacteria bacterium]
MILCLLACLSRAVPTAGSATGTAIAQAAPILASLPAGNLAIRTDSASRLLLGRGYLLGPLGEGDSARGEPKPRFRLDSFDCVTYLETSMALARARDTSDLLSRMDSIRYRDGRAEWRWRNHFFEGDWLPRNGSRVRPMRFPDDTTVIRRLARKGFYAKKGFEVPDTSVHLNLLWRDRAIARFSKPCDSTRFLGVAFVGKVDGYPVLHTGFLVERAGVPALLRHASQAGSVREQPFAEYLTGKTKFVGVVVWELLP